MCGWLSCRKNTKPLWQANGPDPQSRESPAEGGSASDSGPSAFSKACSWASSAASGSPAESAASNPSNRAATAGLVKLRPPSVERAYSIASTPRARLPVVPLHATYTVPLRVTAMSANWLSSEPSEILLGWLKDRPWSVDRANTISLLPLPWNTLQATYTLPAWGLLGPRSTWMEVLLLNFPLRAGVPFPTPTVRT